ncbi:class I/II aminotransferase, partial [Helicosporidium sp. ATCC 50920]
MDSESLSQRTAPIVSQTPSYISLLEKAFADLWDPSNPEGWILAMVAENKLMAARVRERLHEAQCEPLPPWVMCYTDIKGHPPVRETVARFLASRVLGSPAAADEVCLSAGVASLLDNVFYLLGDAGEGVLIPAPYYPAFDVDLSLRSKLVPLPIFLNEAEEIGAQLDRWVEEATSREQPDAGSSQWSLSSDVPPPLPRVTRVCALLATSPNNPTGATYSPDTLAAMVRWAVERKVHLVSDEVYALSAHEENGHAFASVRAVAAERCADLDAEAVDAYLHVLWGLSKDLCGSGLRVGVLHSRNRALLRALPSLAVFGMAGNQVQHTTGLVLGDDAWLDAFFRESADALAGARRRLGEGLRALGVPF